MKPLSVKQSCDAKRHLPDIGEGPQIDSNSLYKTVAAAAKKVSSLQVDGPPFPELVRARHVPLEEGIRVQRHSRQQAPRGQNHFFPG
jgi:hypothetical protein